MTFSRMVVLAVLLSPGLARAQEPEQLLSAKTHLYFRWDGQKAHKDAWQRTALGKMMQGDTGKMFDNLYALLRDNVQSSLTVQGLLDGAPPDQVQKIQAAVAQAMKLPTMLMDHGFVVAVEMQSYLPPSGQATFIIPNCGNPEPLFAALKLAINAQGGEVKQVKAENRTLSVVDLEMVNGAWWQEGKHAVVMVSSMKPDVIVSRLVNGKDGKLADAPMFKKLAEFKEFESSARAFLDIESLVRMAGLFSKDIKQGISAVGLDSLKAITLQSGFENEAERGLLEIHYNGERKGIFAATASKPFKLADVPALPTDVISWSMGTFDAAATYDAVLKAAETLAAQFAPNEAAQIKDFIRQLDQSLGIDVRKDLLGALGDRYLQYSSPAEGAFTLSQTFGFKVKNGDRLLDTMDQLAKGIAAQFNAKILIKKRKYRDIEMREVRINEMGFFFLPSYAVVDGWLVMSYYPQPVQGYILRAKQELPAWKPDETVTQSLNKLPREFLSVSVSDPRPTVKQLLGLAPLVGGTVRSFFPDTKFDPGLIPNAHETCKHLFPNVTAMVDDGKTTRMHTRASLALPFDIAGADALVIAGFTIPLLFAQ